MKKYDWIVQVQVLIVQQSRLLQKKCRKMFFVLPNLQHTGNSYCSLGRAQWIGLSAQFCLRRWRFVNRCNLSGETLTLFVWSLTKFIVSPIVCRWRKLFSTIEFKGWAAQLIGCSCRSDTRLISGPLSLPLMFDAPSWHCLHKFSKGGSKRTRVSFNMSTRYSALALPMSNNQWNL